MNNFVVIGGGIVGLSVANLLKSKGNVTVLEKESKVAQHQSGRNSGVIHSGIYYKPGSSKATNCLKGKRMLEEYCVQNDIPFLKTGKLIVATNKEEETKLESLLERGKQNGITCDLLTKKEMLEKEPYVAGVSAIHVQDTGIVDYKQICRKLSENVNVQYFNEVISIKDNVIDTRPYSYDFDVAINCGGLYSDRIARLSGHNPSVSIVPFRGEYYTLNKPYVNGLIYPVPDPRFPFLGVHFTKMIDGGIECGPNAVLSLGRECYNKFEFNLAELWETLTFPGFWKITSKYWKTGVQEVLRSLSKSLYLRSLQKLVPAVRERDLVDNRPAGIRAQAITKDGNLVDDFLIEKQGNIIHVLNAPSPAATACFAIAEEIVKGI